MIAAADLVDLGEPEFTEEALRDDWRRPELDLAVDTWLLLRDDEVAGYGWLLARDHHRQVEGWALVHPTHRRRGLGAYLVRRAEHRAVEHAAVVPADQEVVLRSGIVSSDKAAQGLLREHGFRLVRHSWRMSISLPRDLDPGRPPRGIHVRPFANGDAPLVHAAFEEAFADHWGHVPRTFESWSTHRLAPEVFDAALWVVALEGEEVVGAVAGIVDDDEGWVETLGVRAPWRGRGIGEALLRRSFATFAVRGITNVSLFVDAGNQTGATRLYERVGMRVRRQYDHYEKRLPGRHGALRSGGIGTPRVNTGPRLGP